MMEPGAVQGPVVATDLKTSIAGLRSGTVTEIRLTGSMFNENTVIKQMQEFAEALGKNKSLTVLYFDCWIGGDEGAKILGAGLEKNESLKLLSIRDSNPLRLNANRVRDRGAAAIASALKNNFLLTELSLNYNAIGTSGIEKLLSTFIDSKTLKTLDLGNNSFDDLAADVFANFLEMNRSVEKLILDGNKAINKPFVEKLFSILVKKNNTLKSLSLQKIEFSRESIELITLLVRLNDNLTEILFDTFRSQDLERKKIQEKLQENSRHKLANTAASKTNSFQNSQKDEIILRELAEEEKIRKEKILSNMMAEKERHHILITSPRKVIEPLLLETKFDEALKSIEEAVGLKANTVGLSASKHKEVFDELMLLKVSTLLLQGEFKGASKCFIEKLDPEKGTGNLFVNSSSLSSWDYKGPKANHAWFIILKYFALDYKAKLFIGGVTEIENFFSSVNSSLEESVVENIKLYSLEIKILLRRENHLQAKRILEELLSIDASNLLVQLMLKEYSSALNKKLTEAIKLNDLQGVKIFYPLILSKESYALALHFTIEQKNINMLNLLLELNSSEINTQDISGQTPLHYAVLKASEEAVQILHKKGADVNAADLQGNTPLHLAILLNSSIMMLLLKLGADPNRQAKDGNNAVHLAIKRRVSVETIQALIEKNPFCNIKNNGGKTPLHFMGENGQIQVLRCWLDVLKKRGVDQKPIINAQDFAGDTPLHCAIQDGGSLELVEIFLKNGADVNQKNLNGDTPIYFALSKQHGELVSLLFNYGARLHILNEKHETAFHLVAKMTSVNIINLLVAQAIKENSLHSLLEIKNKEGFTALQIAVMNGNLSFVETLLNFVRKDLKQSVGSLINFKSSKGSGEQTALHLAVNRGDFDGVKFLVENGADYWLVNSDNQTPLAVATWLAKQGKHKEIKLFLKKQQTQGMNSLITKVFAQQCVPQPPAEILIKNLTLILQQHYLKTWVKQQQGKEFAITLGKHIATAVNTAMKFIKDSNSLAAMVQNNDHEQIQQMLRLIINEAYQNTKKPVQKSPSFIDSMQFSEIVVTQKGLYISRSKLYELKKKAFSRAIKEGIRYLFYVNLALVKGEVKRPDNGFDSARTLFTTLSPSISAAVCEVSQNEKSSFKVGLAFSLVNILFQAIGAYEDRKARMRANCVVEAFQDEGNPDSINIDAIKAIAEILFERFRYQIMQLSVSIGTNGKLRSHGADGVFKFAQVIVQRIGSHILNDGSKEIDASNIQFVRAISGLGNSIGKAFIKLFGQAQNIKAKQLTPLIQRCLMATWLEDVGVDVPIPLDKSQAGKALTWQAGDILCFTGIRDEKQPENCYFRQGYFKEELGYCFASGEEIEFRKYKPYKQIPLEKIEDDDIKDDKKEIQSSSNFTK